MSTTTSSAPRPSALRCRVVLRALLAVCCAILPWTSATALSPEQTLAQFHRTQWSLREGAPGSIAAITQTPDGFLWLGSASGLLRFDGVRFQRFEAVARPGLALKSLSVSALLALPDGRLVIGYRFGGLSVLGADGSLRHAGEAEGVPPASVWQLAADAQGHLWAASGRGLVREQAGRWERIGPEQGLDVQQSFAVLIDRAGAIWVSTEKGVFQRGAGDTRFRRVAPDLVLSRASLALAPDDRVWAYSYADDSRLGPLPRPGEDFAPLKAAWRDATAVNSLRFDRDGSLWLATNDGVQRIAHPDAVAPTERVDIAPPLRGQLENSATGYEDREGNVWVGSASGLDRYRGNKVDLVPLPPNPLFIGLAAGDDGAVWATQWGRGLLRIATPQQPARVMDLPHQAWNLTCLHRDASGRVWFGSAQGLWHLEGDQAVPDGFPAGVGTRNGGTDADVLQAVAVDPAGGVWVSIAGRGVYHRPPGGDWLAVSGEGRWPKAAPMALRLDAEQRLWMGFTQNRLMRLDGEGLTQVTVISGLRVGNVLALLPRDGRTWVGGDAGLAMVDAAGVAHALRAESPDALLGLSGLVMTRDGDLWLNGTTGIVQVPAAELSAALRDPDHALRVRRFDHRDGLPGVPTDLRPLPTAVEGTDGRLWFALKNGLVALDPKHIPKNSQQAPVVIESLLANGRIYAATQDLTLPERSTDLQLDYTALSLSVPERVTFRYRLEGVDADWQEAGLRRSAFYTRLKPGDYRFRVVASNNDGVWNETGATLRFRIPPAFYETRWFAVLCGLMLMVALWGLHRMRLRQVAARLRGRLEARLLERERIARELHDTLLQGFHALMLRFQAATERIPREAPARSLMEEALDRADAVLIEGRQRVLDLRADEAQPLGAALYEAGEVLAVYRQAVFCFNEQGAARPLRPDVRDGFLRVGNEALANAFKHARAQRIEVALCFDEDQLRLCVRDDGVGIDPQVLATGRRPGHWGLTGMRERAQALGGELSIRSAAGGGTELAFTLPAAAAYVDASGRPIRPRRAPRHPRPPGSASAPPDR